MARIPYLNEWTVSYALRDAAGSLIQPTSIACAVTNANGSAVSLSATPTWDSTTATTLLSFTATEVGASAYCTEWTMTWTGTASGTDFTDVEPLIVVAPGQETWLTTVYEVKQFLGVNDSSDDADIADIIEQVEGQVRLHYGLPSVPKVTEARYITVLGERLVLLDECVSITSIADDSGNLLDTDDYTVVYGRTANDHLRGFKLTSEYVGQLTVTGSWGYDDTPPDVRRGIFDSAAMWYKRQKRGDANDVIGGLSALSKTTRDIFDARMRVSI